MSAAATGAGASASVGAWSGRRPRPNAAAYVREMTETDR